MKTQLVVIEGHTLGYILPGNPNVAHVLHSSILKGGSGNDNPIYLHDKSYRLASDDDFKDFRVSFDGYRDSKDYIYKQSLASLNTAVGWGHSLGI